MSRNPEIKRGGPLVVTGAAGGIGLATAQLAAGRGRSVAMLDRDEDALRRAAAAIGELALGIPCDVSDERAVDAAFEAARAQLGPPAGVVACAGIDRGGLVHELDAAAWDVVQAVNLRGAFLTCRAAVRQMLEAGGGAIVCVSSPLGAVSIPGGTGAYSASKAGISALVRSLAVDYGKHGIRANAVLPGPTETELMWANVAPADVAPTRAIVRDEVPLGRMADPEEPARAILWLLSSDASYVTGSQLACDGGVLAKASVSV